MTRGVPVFNRVRDDAPHYLYRCYDAAGVLLYVGCSNNPVVRVEQHKDSWWGDRIARVRNLVFADRPTALAKERRAIFTERPTCNVRGRWYKHDPRDDWSLEDYRTYRTAVVRTANGYHGTANARLLARIDSEVQERFGVSLLAERKSA